jgi:hypothetical protein
MNPLEVLEDKFKTEFDELSEKIEIDLNRPKKVEELQKIEFNPKVVEFMDAYKQSRINKKTTEYWHYNRLYNEKKNEPEFAKYLGLDFSKLIKYDRDFKKLLDQIF